MWRNLASNALTFFVVLLFVIGGVIIWGKQQYDSPGPLAQAICLKVERGSNMARVSRELEARGAVSSGTLFRMGANYENKASDLKAGSFLIRPGSSMREIVEAITQGGKSTCGTEVVYRIGVRGSEIRLRQLDPASNRYVETLSFDPLAGEIPAAYRKAREEGDLRYRIALAEGVTSWQVAEALKAADFLEGEIAEIPPEGWLAPDSYEVKAGSSRTDLIARMRAAQERILAEAWENRAEGLPLTTPEEALILASLIEKETGVSEERRQVASVFINRLKKGMRLQTDPAVIYGITRGQGVLGRGLRQSELRRQTPYNTYLIDGLPPTPIANPGRASIEAAINPDDTDFLFFVADGTGGHAFARTLREHNRNVARWRKIEAERSGN